MLNNVCESFNATIFQARFKSILGMLESIRTYLMTRHEVKEVWARKHDGPLCPKIQKYIEKLKEESSVHIPRGAGSKRYQVEVTWGDKYVVDLEAKTYTKWEFSGYHVCILLCYVMSRR